MKTTESVPAWEEIIFEGRNKLYGAYELRTQYNSRLVKSFLITLSGFSLLVILFFVLRKEDFKNNNEVFAKPDDIYRITQIDPVQTKKENFVEGQKPEQHHAAEGVFLPVDTLEDKPDTTLLANNNSTQSGAPAEGSTTGTGIHSDTTSSKGPSIAQSLYGIASVDTSPQFPGGMEKFYDFLVKNIHYSIEAREMGVQGHAYVSFVVDENGLITDLKIVRRVGYGLDEEVIKVLKKSPRWSPGIVRNTPVKTEMTLPVSFNIGK